MKRSDFLKRSAIISGSIVLFKELPAAHEEAFASLTPLPEASTLPKALYGYQANPGPWVIEYGFEQAAALPWHLEKFNPVLIRRALPANPAYNIKVEWLHRGKKHENYTQIVRTPFSASNAQMASTFAREEGRDRWSQITRQALKSHLKAVEEILEHSKGSNGVIQRNGYEMSIHTLSGSRQLLGRLPRRSDTFVLRPLRDLALLTNRQANDADMRTDEWLSEITLEAHR